MLPVIERTPEELNDALMTRVENLASDLLMLSGITKRGAALPDDYRAVNVPALRRLAMRVLDSLERGTPSQQPWDRQTGLATGSGEG